MAGKFASSQPAINNAAFYNGRELKKNQLLELKSGQGRMETLEKMTQNGKPVWVWGGRIFEKATDGDYWVEVSNFKGQEPKGSIHTVPGGGKRQ